MPTGSVDGLVSGLDTTTIISQLMQLERQPQLRLQNQQATAKKILGIYQTLNTKFDALKSAASAISRPLDWKAVKATSSSPDAVTATATSAAQLGTLSFSVKQLARAGSVASAGTVASTSVVVANGPVLVAKGADVLGFSAVSGLSGLSVGKHTIEVTQATAGAVQRSADPLSATMVFSGGNGTLSVKVDGADVNITLADGSYTAEELAEAITRESNGTLSATVDGEGRLQLTTTHEGSTASLEITGGTLGELFRDELGDLPAASTGIDGSITVDGGAAIVVDSAGSGVTTTLDGVIDVTFAGGLRTGTMTAANVDTGDGSLASLAAAVNQAGVGISAAAVKVGTDQYRLQIASTTTGAASNVIVDTANLTGSLGGFTPVQSGRDAVIKIGEGDGAYEVSSATDTVTDVLPGVTLQLRKADLNATVTVSVTPDGDALATKVGALITAANDALAFIKAQGSYDPDTKVAGPLLADGKARMLTQQILGAVSGALAGSSLTTSSVGVTLARDGTISFDKGKFLEAYGKDPDGVAALFRAGGTASAPGATFVAASATARAGSYAVEITQAATQARATGAVLAGGTIDLEETISVRFPAGTGKTASFTARAGATLDEIATGLNAAFAREGLALAAVIDNGTTLAIRSAAYGSSVSFEVSSSTGNGAGQTGFGGAPDEWVASTAGQDVKATIDGGTELTGSGQLLTVPDGNSGAGLSLNLSGAQGTNLTFTYAPGLAQRFNSLASAAVAFGTGTISTAISGRQSAISDLDRRISDWDVRLSLREQNLRRQFSGLETALGKLRDQSNWLAGQLASLPTGGS